MPTRTDDKKLIYGNGSAESLGSVLREAGLKRPLVVSTLQFSNTSFYQAIMDSLDVDYVRFNEITRGPPMPEVEHLAESFNNHECDSIVSMGNSSVIWASKVLKYYFAHSAHHTAIPSTLTPSAFSNWTEYWMGDDLNYITASSIEPDTVILDPEASATIDGAIWKASGLGVMDYAFSNLLRSRISDETEELMITAIEILIVNLPGISRESRLEALLSTWHSKEERYSVRKDPITEIRQAIKEAFDIPEELTSALTLPVTAHRVMEKYPSRMARLAETVGFRGTDDSALARRTFEAIQGFVRKLGITSELESYGIMEHTIRDVISTLPLSDETAESMLSSIY